jgi:hypothetical protein
MHRIALLKDITKNDGLTICIELINQDETVYRGYMVEDKEYKNPYQFHKSEWGRIGP